MGQKLYQLRLYLERKVTALCDCRHETELLCYNLEKKNCNLFYHQVNIATYCQAPLFSIRSSLSHCSNVFLNFPSPSSLLYALWSAPLSMILRLYHQPHALPCMLFVFAHSTV